MEEGLLTRQKELWPQCQWSFGASYFLNAPGKGRPKNAVLVGWFPDKIYRFLSFSDAREFTSSALTRHQKRRIKIWKPLVIDFRKDVCFVTDGHIHRGVTDFSSLMMIAGWWMSFLSCSSQHNEILSNLCIPGAIWAQLGNYYWTQLHQILYLKFIIYVVDDQLNLKAYCQLIYLSWPTNEPFKSGNP